MVFSIRGAQRRKLKYLPPKVTIEGHDLRYEKIAGVIEENGGAIHSIDEVAAGRVLIEDVITPQD